MRAAIRYVYTIAYTSGFLLHNFMFNEFTKKEISKSKFEADIYASLLNEL